MRYAICVCEFRSQCLNFMLFYLRVQRTNYINSQHKEVWITHFILSTGFVRRGMYILQVKLQYLALDWDSEIVTFEARFSNYFSM